MTPLAQAVHFCVGLDCDWSTEEVSALAEAAPRGTRAYLVRLRGEGVLEGTGTDRWRAGPAVLVTAWRKRVRSAQSHDGGGCRRYQMRKSVRDTLAQRDWQSRRPGNPQVLTVTATTDAVQVPPPTTTDDTMTTTAPQPPAWTPEQLAEVLNVDRETVLRRIRQGKIRAVDLGSIKRIPYHELKRLGVVAP